jgi:hypothetical protein
MNCPFGCITNLSSAAPVFNKNASGSVLKKLQHHIMKRNCKAAKTFDVLFFSNTDDIQKGKGIYHCKACGESFRRKQNLEGHSRKKQSCKKSSQQHDPLAYENSWFAKLDLFVEYHVKAIGHGDIKKSYINGGNPVYKKKFEVLLSSWWSNTNKKRKSDLSANKISPLLNQNGFVWELSYSHESNESRVQAIRDLYLLLQIKPEPGMFHVPLRKLTGGENNPLGNNKWLSKCRADGGKNMTSELQSALEFMVGPL